MAEVLNYDLQEKLFGGPEQIFIHIYNNTSFLYPQMLVQKDVAQQPQHNLVAEPSRWWVLPRSVNVLAQHKGQQLTVAQRGLMKRKAAGVGMPPPPGSVKRYPAK